MSTESPSVKSAQRTLELLELVARHPHAVLIAEDMHMVRGALAALLDLTWQIPGFLPGEASPGGALAFEQLRDVSTGKRFVRLAYYAQTLDEMRRRAPLNYRDPPGMVQVALPACSADLVNNACPLDSFLKIVRTAVDPGCVTVTVGNF